MSRSFHKSGRHSAVQFGGPDDPTGAHARVIELLTEARALMNLMRVDTPFNTFSLADVHEPLFQGALSSVAGHYAHAWREAAYAQRTLLIRTADTEGFA